jgi:RNA polymerase sigma-70 factor (ECF subfamily)
MGAPPDPHEGNDAAPGEELGRWAERYGPALRRYFQKKVNAAEAEDLVQNVFLSIHARGEAAGDIENVEGYLFRTAANALARRFARDAWNPDELGEGLEPWDEASPERALIAKQELERVAAVLDSLPPRTRQAFMLHRFEEMTYLSIARKMGITKVAVGKLIKRAVLRLNERKEARP